MKLTEILVLYDLCTDEIIELFLDRNEAINLYNINIKDSYIINRNSSKSLKNMTDEQYDEHFKKYFENNIVSIITLDEAIEKIKQKLTDHLESIIYSNYN